MSIDASFKQKDTQCHRQQEVGKNGSHRCGTNHPSGQRRCRFVKRLRYGTCEMGDFALGGILKVSSTSSVLKRPVERAPGSSLCCRRSAAVSASCSRIMMAATSSVPRPNREMSASLASRGKQCLRGGRASGLASFDGNTLILSVFTD